MRHSKTMLLAAVTFLLTSALLPADETGNERPSSSSKTYPPQSRETEATSQQAQNTQTFGTKDQSDDKAQQAMQTQDTSVGKSQIDQKKRNWGANMPASASPRYGEGVGYPGYRRHGVEGTGYPQHNQYGNPPLKHTGDQPIQHSKSRSDSVAGEVNKRSSRQETDKSTSRRIHADKHRALLHAAAFGDRATLNTLLNEGVSPNTRSRDKFARTVLILAAAGGHADLVEALLNSGARVDDRDTTGHTALNWAAMRGQVQAAKALLKRGADINIRNNGDISPLLYAVGTHNIAMLKLLVEKKVDLEVESRENKMTPLLLAIETNDMESVNILLDKGAEVNGYNSDHFSPLMAAAEKGQTELIQILLARGAEPDAQDAYGRTALMLAADAGKQDAVKMLQTSAAEREAGD